MAEGRFISRSIATNGQLKRVSLEADYLFGRMIPHLDREGRIDGDPDVVKAMACPLRSELTPELIATCMAELDTVGLIEWYEVDGRQVAQFPAFKAHQRGMKPERERASVLPDRGAQGSKPVRRTVNSGARAEAAVQPPASVAANSPTSAPKLSEVKVSEVKTSAGAVSWPVEGSEWHAEFIAPITPGRFGKILKPTVDRVGWQKTFPGLKVWEMATRGKTRKLQWFADDSVRWVDLAQMPPVDPVTRELTDLGRLALA